MKSNRIKSLQRSQRLCPHKFFFEIDLLVSEDTDKGVDFLIESRQPNN